MLQDARPLHHARYMPRKVIGTGTYGQVLRCYDRNAEREVAVKVAHKAPAYRRSAINESNVLHQLNNVQGCKVVGVVETFEEDGRIYIVSELLHKNLYEVICDKGYKGFSLDELRVMGKNLLSALSELHNLGFMHCDVKPENTMIPRHGSCDVRLIDFGSVRKLEENAYFDIQSLWYRAPEVICGVPYTPAIDAWSCGCLFAELCTGGPLFPGDSPQQQLSMIIELLGHPSYEALNTGKYSATMDFGAAYLGGFDGKFTRHIGSSDDALMFLEMLQGLLNPDERYRWSVEEALAHPFFTNEPWTRGHGRYGRQKFLNSTDLAGSFFGLSSTGSDSAASSPERTFGAPDSTVSPFHMFSTAPLHAPAPIGEEI